MRYNLFRSEDKNNSIYTHIYCFWPKKLQMAEKALFLKLIFLGTGNLTRNLIPIPFFKLIYVSYFKTA